VWVSGSGQKDVRTIKWHMRRFVAGRESEDRAPTSGAKDDAPRHVLHPRPIAAAKKNLTRLKAKIRSMRARRFDRPGGRKDLDHPIAAQLPSSLKIKEIGALQYRPAVIIGSKSDQPS
jgi:hypothetical protein